MDATLVLALILIGVFWWIISKQSRENKFLNGFPGPMKFPLIGNSWCLAKSEGRLANLMGLQEKYGNRVSVTVGHQLKLFCVFHPDDVGNILTSKGLNKPEVYDMMYKDWLGVSLFYAKGKEHFRMRKFVQPVFDYKAVENYQLNFNEHSKTLIQIFKSRQAKEQNVDIRWLLPLCALECFFQYFVGKSVGCLEVQDNKYAIAVHHEITCVFQRGWSPWLWPEILWKISPTGTKEKVSRIFIQDFMDKNVQDRKNEIFCADSDSLPKTIIHDKGKAKLLDHLIRAQYNGEPGITDKYIRDETNGAIFAGHDTTGSLLIFATFLLAAHPDEQAIVHRELDEIFGDDKSREVDSVDLGKLKHLEYCIKETLRLYPSAPITLRAPENDFQLDEKTTVPKGVDFFMSAWVTHRLPEFWPEPEEFRPSRFFPGNCAGRHPYSYIPFSAGPRNCMGQKIAFVLAKTVLAHIFRNFRVELESPPESMIPLSDMVVYPKDALKVKLQCR